MIIVQLLVSFEPGQRVRAAHNRADHDITGSIKDC
jgi:hypothetical protein